MTVGGVESIALLYLDTIVFLGAYFMGKSSSRVQVVTALDHVWGHRVSVQASLNRAVVYRVKGF